MKLNQLVIKFVSLSSLVLSASSFANTAPTQLPMPLGADSSFSQDYGYITNLYASASGTIAFELVGGFPVANGANQCPGNNGYAAAENADPALKSLILEAEARKSKVAVETKGCDGRWLKITGAYIVGQS